MGLHDRVVQCAVRLIPDVRGVVRTQNLVGVGGTNPLARKFLPVVEEAFAQVLILHPSLPDQFVDAGRGGVHDVESDGADSLELPRVVHQELPEVEGDVVGRHHLAADDAPHIVNNLGHVLAFLGDHLRRHVRVVENPNRATVLLVPCKVLVLVGVLDQCVVDGLDLEGLLVHLGDSDFEHPVHRISD